MEPTKSAFAAEAAHAVVRKYFVRLHKAVADHEVQMKLYSCELIDEATLSMCEADQTGKKILFSLKEKISQMMDDSVINQLCQILKEKKDHQLDSLVQDMRCELLILET